MGTGYTEDARVITERPIGPGIDFSTRALRGGRPREMDLSGIGYLHKDESRTLDGSPFYLYLP